MLRVNHAEIEAKIHFEAVKCSVLPAAIRDPFIPPRLSARQTHYFKSLVFCQRSCFLCSLQHQLLSNFKVAKPLEAVMMIGWQLPLVLEPQVILEERLAFDLLLEELQSLADLVDRPVHPEAHFEHSCL